MVARFVYNCTYHRHTFYTPPPNPPAIWFSNSFYTLPNLSTGHHARALKEELLANDEEGQEDGTDAGGLQNMWAFHDHINQENISINNNNFFFNYTTTNNCVNLPHTIYLYIYIYMYLINIAVFHTCITHSFQASGCFPLWRKCEWGEAFCGCVSYIYIF